MARTWQNLESEKFSFIAWVPFSVGEFLFISRERESKRKKNDEDERWYEARNIRKECGVWLDGICWEISLSYVSLQNGMGKKTREKKLHHLIYFTNTIFLKSQRYISSTFLNILNIFFILTFFCPLESSHCVRIFVPLIDYMMMMKTMVLLLEWRFRSLFLL